MSYPNQQYGPPPGYGDYQQPRPGNGLAIASLVCGIIGIIIFAIVLGPLSIVFGGVGLSRANKGASHKGIAIAGLVLGIIDTVFGIIAIALLSGHHFSTI